ncbi:hypothetical protein I7I51_08941 [Histoplasma capsulatum]|uniref:Uncharacterized protein n=1 Tax=Ajellomyces capsulatus TaxID=5037 RepID=A0A8A1LZ91_AJECA|nr:hypothetical protein I7I51_08941 [Histoplasma capsulatum]
MHSLESGYGVCTVCWKFLDQRRFLELPVCHRSQDLLFASDVLDSLAQIQQERVIALPPQPGSKLCRHISMVIQVVDFEKVGDSQRTLMRFYALYKSWQGARDSGIGGWARRRGHQSVQLSPRFYHAFSHLA